MKNVPYYSAADTTSLFGDNSTLIFIILITVLALGYFVIWFAKNPTGDRRAANGKRLADEKKYDLAKSAYLNALSSGKFKRIQYFTVYHNLGYIEFKLNNYDAAIEHCTEAVKRNTKDYVAFSIMGKAYSAKGESLLAIENWKKSLEIKEDAATYADVAVEYARAGDQKSAMTATNDAQRLKYADVKGLRRRVKNTRVGEKPQTDTAETPLTAEETGAEDNNENSNS